MDTSELVDQAKKVVRRYGITDGESFRLKDHDPADTGALSGKDKPRAQEMLADGIRLLSEMQDKLYAQNRWSVLLIFQAMDAAGKDGAIKHVMSGVNPQGCDVHPFKAPTHQELDHDFLWRCSRMLPARGKIGIFNRSYYEEVLVVRVHEGILRSQQLPPELITKDIWSHRLKDIRSHERYLSRNGTVVRKFFLNVSRDEQRRRFIERIDNPTKNWKFNEGDVAERAHWDDYMAAYEDAIRATATPESPWFVVPADNKWFTRLVVAGVVIDTLASLNLAYPTLDPVHQARLASARQSLLSER
jgi:PPK2 family polyphosphate:nucleotide phosphotransferase